MPGTSACRYLLETSAILVILAPACASPNYSSPQPFPSALIDDSTVATGPLQWVLHAGDEWIRVRVSNTGDGPVVLSWHAAQWLTSDGKSHHVVDARQFPDFVATHHAMTAVQSRQPLNPAEEARQISRRLADALKHRAPANLRPSGDSRLGKGETAEWTLYPAEHIAIDVHGNVIVQPLFEAHTLWGADPLRPFFTLTVPIRVDGTWTTIAATGRAYSGIR